MKAAYPAALGARRRPPEALRAALLAVPLLPQIVSDLLTDAEEFGPRDWVPAPWPPVTLGLQLASILEDEGAIDQISGVLHAHDELASWRYLIEPARQSLRDVSAILGYVRSHPGAIQSRLGGEIGQGQVLVTSRCLELAAAGSLRRERVWRSYALFVP
ncbi:MAG: hypothetical protein WA751_10670 [Candidatus Dormiibacterota bacterium]